MLVIPDCLVCMIYSKSVPHEQLSHLYLATPESMAYPPRSGWAVRGSDYLSAAQCVSWISVLNCGFAVLHKSCVALHGDGRDVLRVTVLGSTHSQRWTFQRESVLWFMCSQDRNDLGVGIANLCFLHLVYMYTACCLCTAHTAMSWLSLARSTLSCQGAVLGCCCSAKLSVSVSEGGGDCTGVLPESGFRMGKWCGAIGAPKWVGVRY